MTGDDRMVLSIGGEIPVHRMGFGAMRLTGWGDWGSPDDWDEAVRVARRAVELGVTFIDTADAYGPGTNEELLAAALHPYPPDVVVATKAGQSRPSRTEWKPLGRPEYLRQQAELSLRRLRLERIELFQLHRIDPLVPPADQFGALRRLQDDGKVRFVGLSEVTVDQLRDAREHVDVVSVQNRYNVLDRGHEPVLRYCEDHGIAFIPWLPVASGGLAGGDGPIAEVAKELDATPAQVALAWLLRHSPVMLPIPGTSSMVHLEENVAAATVQLSDEQYGRLAALAG